MLRVSLQAFVLGLWLTAACKPDEATCMDTACLREGEDRSRPAAVARWYTDCCAFEA